MPDPPVAETVEAQDALPRTDIDLEAELEELRAFARSRPSVVNHALWVDLDEFETRIERIVTHLPKEVKRARRITRDEKQILDDATAEAGRIINEARQEAQELIEGARAEAARIVDESAIKQAAVQQAEEILRRAQQSANEVRDRAFAYGRDLLVALESTVDSMMKQIRLGQEQLRPPEDRSE